MAYGPNLAVIKGNKAYGDQKALDSLTRQSSGLSFDNAGPVTERRGAGRPQGSAQVAGVPGAAPAPEPLIPQEHAALIESFARAALVAQVGEASRRDMMAGPWLAQYAEFAQNDLAKKGVALQTGTPNFEP